ncbi:GEVED domain-containing protein [Nonomuraea sp. NPDC050540]|uniref:GEVED domain-containing protein n=1 Tax=Nonomuraea sp. NPDC050540 TaxID=3364367 RepID=UPI0037B20F6F
MASKGKRNTWTMANTVENARGVAPSGIIMTVEKKMASGTRVAKAETLRADPGAPADEYLDPVNAKAAAGISDLYEGFAVQPNGWSDVATLTFRFSSPVRNPRLHVAGTGGATVDSAGNREEYWTGLRLLGGTPSRPTFSKIAGFPGFDVDRQAIVPNAGGRQRETTCGVVYMCGTAQVNGMVSSFTVDVRARNVRRTLPAGDPFMWGVFRVTFEQDDSDAPASYGAASHSISDQSIGASATSDRPGMVSFTPRRRDDDQDDASAGRLEAGQDGRLQLTVPVRTTSSGVLAGWVDFDRDGRFQPSERASAVLPANSARAVLTWAPPQDAKPGPSWLRLRLAEAAAEVSVPTGWAATGEVEDHRVNLLIPGQVRLSHTAPNRIGKGERLTFTTRVRNSGQTALPYHLSMRLDDVLDDAKVRAINPRPASRTRSALTWQGTLEPGATREIRVRVQVKRGDLGNGKVATRWPGTCGGERCGASVAVRD